MMMEVKTTLDPYFNWLCRKVDIRPNRSGVIKPGYTMLASALHQHKYRSGKIKLDDNRAMDGIRLRVDFMDECGALGSSADRGPCTVLEFLIGIAKRMSYLMGSEDNPYHTAHYFWVMIKNLGLEGLNDDRFEYHHGDFRVQDAVDRLFDRNYDRNGLGGLFPVKDIGRYGDMRKVEIWYQMQQWLIENSDIGLDI